MISLFPNKFCTAPAETWELSAPTGLLAWLEEKAGRTIDVLQPQPISVRVNGAVVPPKAWLAASIEPSDTVHIYVEPKGDTFSRILNVFTFGTWGLVTKLLTPKVAGAGSSVGAPQGDALDEAAATGNKVKINDVIPENAGWVRRFPDYLLPPRRSFRGPRSQWVEMLLCVGQGEYQIDINRIKIGDTPVISLGSDAEITIYGPGANLSAETAAAWWHPCEEVGASSSGSAGLELTVGTGLTNSATATSALFSGTNISIAPAAGSFPADWSTSLLIRVVGNYPYTVASGGGTGGRDIISGDITSLGLANGDTIEIAGSSASNNGTYLVFSQTATNLQLSNLDGSAATGFVAGAMNATIGPKGLRYRILAFSTSIIQVERLTSTGAVDATWPGFPTRTISNPIISLDATSLVGGYRGPFAACPQNELVTKLEFDVFFASGLYGFGREGQIYKIAAYIDFEYRDMAVAGAWTVVSQTISNDSIDAVGYTFVVNLPYAMRPECRMKRRATTIERPNEANDKSQWYGLRGLMQKTVTSYPGVTVIAAKIRGGDRLSADSESQLSCEPIRILPGPNGEPATPTRDIAPWFRYVCNDIGYAATDIDIAELVRLHNIWSPRQDYFDFSFTKATTVKEALSDTVRPGFAEVTIDEGRLKPVRNEPRSTFANMYTAHEMTGSLSTTFTSKSPDDVDGVDVAYLDRETWQKATVKCRLPGDAGVRAETITLEGVTDRDHAYRIGMRQRRVYEYQRKEYKWGTEMSGLNSPYLSFDAVSDSVPGFPQSAVLLSVTPVSGGYNLESSEVLEWDSLTEHLISLRQKDGSVSGPYSCTRVNDRTAFVGSSATIPAIDWDTTPPTLLFGRPYPVLVTQVAPDGTDEVTLTAVNYDARIYLDDDSLAPD